MDIELYASEHGAGDALVLLHGNGSSGEYFAPQIEYFSKERRVIAVDTRGHGQSPRGTAPFTLEQFAGDLYEFLRDKGLEKIDLLGFSDGGNIAMLFAMEHPEMVRKLILNGANLTPGGVVRKVQLEIARDYWKARIESVFDKEKLPQMEMLRLMVKEPHIDPRELGKLTMPTLVMAGTEDIIRSEETKRIAASIPGAELKFIPGGHCIAAENPEVYNETVARFLRRS